MTRRTRLAWDFEARYARGQHCRTKVRRVDQGEWRPRARNFDLASFLLAANRGRLPNLLPIKFGRMAASPFGFFRGAVPLMASDLAGLPTTGLACQICGDAHVLNFGAYAITGRRLVFDINDFDETTAGPWEWDIKRMAASIVLAGREAGVSDNECKLAARGLVRAYRTTLQQFSRMSVLEVARFEVHRHMRILPIESALHKAEHATPLETLEKLTISGKRSPRVFREQKPLLSHLPHGTIRQVLAALRPYRNSLVPRLHHFFDQYRPADVAFKVVGTGSVGLRDYVVLLFGSHPDDPLFLQVKEEPTSAYAPYLRNRSVYSNQGQRVVEGQRRMQSHSDMLLGWTSMDGRDYLVRQLRDHKAAVDPSDLKGRNLADYAQLCGELLAKGHGRSGDFCALAGYCGSASKLDRAIAKFAIAYADQTTADYEKLRQAVRNGQIKTARA